MSLNVMKEYIEFDRDRIRDIASVVLEKFYDKGVFNRFLDMYISIRFYDVNGDIKGGKRIGVINDYLTKCYRECFDGDNRDCVKFCLYFFGFVYYLDGVSSRFSNEEILDKINLFRESKLSLDKLNGGEFMRLIRGYEKRVDKFREEMSDKNYYVKYMRSNLDGVWWCDLVSCLKIPDLYSESSIRNVYDNGIVYENRLFVLYYMVSFRVLCDIIDLRFNNFYLVDFCESLFEKEEKIERILGIIDDDILMERVIIMIEYSLFDKYRKVICELINRGYGFGLYISDRDMDDTLFSLFRFVCYRDMDGNIVKKV